jgi:hypothetical protein
MKRCTGFLSLLIIVLVLSTSDAGGGPPQKTPASAAPLGNLKIEISKVAQTMMVGDAFTGPSIYALLGQIYLRIKNVGNLPVCSKIVASVEEYKDSELRYTQSQRSSLP